MAHRSTIYARKIREELIAKLGGKCALCPCDDVTQLEFDHKHGSVFVLRMLSYSARMAMYKREYMTEEDFQTELFQAESAFDPKEESVLWEAEKDKGVMVIGKQGGKWFGAIRANIGNQKIEERLDGEQSASKKRPDCVKQTLKRCVKWIESVTDRETAKGFKNQLALVESQHAEREE